MVRFYIQSFTTGSRDIHLTAKQGSVWMHCICFSNSLFFTETPTHSWSRRVCSSFTFHPHVFPKQSERLGWSQANYTWLLWNFPQVTSQLWTLISASTVLMLPRVVRVWPHSLSTHSINPRPCCFDTHWDKSQQTERGLTYFPSPLQSCLDIGGSCGLVWTRFTCECASKKKPV